MSTRALSARQPRGFLGVLRPYVISSSTRPLAIKTIRLARKRKRRGREKRVGEVIVRAVSILEKMGGKRLKLIATRFRYLPCPIVLYPHCPVSCSSYLPPLLTPLGFKYHNSYSSYRQYLVLAFPSESVSYRVENPRSELM